MEWPLTLSSLWCLPSLVPSREREREKQRRRIREERKREPVSQRPSEPAEEKAGKQGSKGELSLWLVSYWGTYPQLMQMCLCVRACIMCVYFSECECEMWVWERERNCVFACSHFCVLCVYYTAGVFCKWWAWNILYLSKTKTELLHHTSPIYSSVGPKTLPNCWGSLFLSYSQI